LNFAKQNSAGRAASSLAHFIRSLLASGYPLHHARRRFTSGGWFRYYPSRTVAASPPCGGLLRPAFGGNYSKPSKKLLPCSTTYKTLFILIYVWLATSVRARVMGIGASVAIIGFVRPITIRLPKIQPPSGFGGVSNW
jgi:hypothetical protein